MPFCVVFDKKVLRVTNRESTLLSKYSMLEAFFLSSFLMHVEYDNQIGMPVCATQFHDTVCRN